jgi:dipeptidyl aminopeptidase/acylaminoacyl peptidase
VTAKDQAGGKASFGQRDTPDTPFLVGGLVSRRVLFAAAERGHVQLSPDGERIAFVGAANGADNAWVAPRDDLAAARVVSPFRRGGIVELRWAHDNRHLLVVRDTSGHENTRIHSVDVESGKVVDVVAAAGIQACIVQLSPRFPTHVLVSANDADPAKHSIYRVDIRTGVRRRWYPDDESHAAVSDDRFEPLLLRARDGKALRVTKRLGVRRYHPFPALDPGDSIVGFDHRGRTLYVVGYAKLPALALVAIDMKTGERTVLASHARYDVDRVVVHPRTGVVQAVSFTGARESWRFLDYELAVDFDRLRDADAGDIRITSRSLDDRWWTVVFDRDDAPVRYYLYDRLRKTARRLFARNADLEGLPLCPMRSVEIPRGRVHMVSYLTLPRRWEEKKRPVPMVLLVHGGPHSRDYWGLDTTHQWLASRGYAVLSVNFRGSTGFGKEFLLAGRRQWGTRMQEDLEVAVDWAIAEGIAIADRVAIMGASYGGYAALAGLVFSPRRFACGVSLAGPSNLVSTVLDGPPHWDREVSFAWVGDPRHVVGREELLRRSPSEWVEVVERPLLVVHGANDMVVSRAESDRIVAELRRRGKQVTYLMFADEGHGLTKPSNVVAYCAVAEAFLARHLGGRAEPLGTDLEGSDMIVLAGVDHVPGLRSARIAATFAGRRSTSAGPRRGSSERRGRNVERRSRRRAR